MNWRSPLFLGLVALGVGLLVAGGYLVTRLPRPQPESRPSPLLSSALTPSTPSPPLSRQSAAIPSEPPASSPSISPPPSGTTNAPTYLDPDYHFGFAYPPTWRVQRQPEPGPPGALAQMTFDVIAGSAIQNGQEMGGFGIIIYPNPKGLSLDDWLSTIVPPEARTGPLALTTRPSRMKFGNAREVLEETSPQNSWFIRGNSHIYQFVWAQNGTLDVTPGETLIPSTFNLTD